MASNLIKNLRSNPDNEDLFECNASVVSYKTGIPVLDYYIGYPTNNKTMAFFQGKIIRSMIMYNSLRKIKLKNII